MSVSSAVSGFVSNFMTALNPQITKNYASGNFDYMFKLAFQGARLSYYILLIFTLPIVFTAPYLLKLWLGIVPEYAANFVSLVLFFTLSECLANPLITIMLATGEIRNYQLVVGGLQLLNLPLSYFFLKMGFPAEVLFIVAIFVSVICEMSRLLMLRTMVDLSIRMFMRDVYFNVILVTLLASVAPFLLLRIFDLDNFLHFVVIVLMTALSTMLVIYFIGCSQKDKLLINNFFLQIVDKIKK